MQKFKYKFDFDISITFVNPEKMKKKKKKKSQEGCLACVRLRLLDCLAAEKVRGALTKVVPLF